MSAGKEFQELHAKCLEHLVIIKSSFGDWLDEGWAVEELREIEAQLSLLSDEMFEAGYNDAEA